MARRGWISLFVLISLTACSQRRADIFALVAPDALESDLADFLRHQADPASALAAMREQRGLPLSFWAEAVPSEVAPYVHEHPCGDTLTALVQRVPAIGEKSFLVAERVVELDAEGREIREWHMPIDSVVFGIRGDAILLRSPAGVGEGAVVVGLSLLPDGNFTIAAKQENTAVAIPCPPLPSFGQSDYLRCWRFADLATGRQRFLAYQGPCS